MYNISFTNSRLATLLLFIFSAFFGMSDGNAQTAKNMSLVGTLGYAQNCSDIWGYVDSTGIEYAIVGVRNGVSVVSLADPGSPSEVLFVPGPNSIWRDIKTWDKHAYITNETSGGLQIIDLSNLPGPLSATNDVYSWTGGAYQSSTVNFSSVHNLYIDENGFVYLAGANYGVGGIIIGDLSNPKSPTVAGVYNANYCHDVYARGDTMYTSEIYIGQFRAIDVSNKTNLIDMGGNTSFNAFTHNAWPNDNTTAVFTTDETGAAYIQAHSISDLGNVEELDKIRSSLSNGTAIPHNVHVKNDFIVTSYYRDGVNVVDAARPHNLIEVGYYDTSPLTGSGFNGAWGAYPFLPSGLVIVSDIEGGLFVFQPQYVRGCYLEGTVTDFITGLPVFAADVEIIFPIVQELTDAQGGYAMGMADSGQYDVQITKIGYIPQIVTVNLQNGVLTQLDIQLVPLGVTNYDLQVLDMQGNPIPSAEVGVELPGGTEYFTTDVNGEVEDMPIPPGNHVLLAGKWGYQTDTMHISVFDTIHQWTMNLPRGFYDDFTFDLGWTTAGDAITGKWTRGEPNGTSYNGEPMNPDVDITSDFNNKAYVTGNKVGGVGDDDVDGGINTLTSPSINLTNFSDPKIEYYYWFANAGGSTQIDDTLFVTLDNGSTTAIIDTVTGDAENFWQKNEFYVLDYMALTSNTKLVFRVADDGGGHLVEAAVDGFRVTDVIAACGKDVNEPNNSQNAAVNLFGGSIAGFNDMKICPRTDLDWYYFDLTKTKTKVTISLKDLPANYDLEIYHGGSLIASGNNTGTQNEIITLNNPPLGTYQIKVSGANGAWDPTDSYSLIVNMIQKAPAGSIGTKPPLGSSLIKPAAGNFDATVFPNPATEQINVSLVSDIEIPVDLKVIALDGRILDTQKLNIEEGVSILPLSLKGLPSGMYIIELRGKEVYLQRKFIKN